MLPAKKTFNNTDEYIALFPAHIRDILQKLRATIKNSAPGAEEVISYKMPAFKLNGMLVWFAANKEHIGFYPTPSPIIIFKKELAGYKTSKGAIQFPIEKAIPLTLVEDIVKFRVKENLQKSKTKSKKKTSNSK
ncbi:MAG: iron chaperone [Chitinophagales bacterium]